MGMSEIITVTIGIVAIFAGAYGVVVLTFKTRK